MGGDVFSNPEVAKRNMPVGPGTWGVNLGVHKDFRFSERGKAQLGADIDNLSNHPLFSPDFNYGGGGGPFAFLGDFNLAVDQKTGRLLPITDVTPNPDFGRLINRLHNRESIAAGRFDCGCGLRGEPKMSPHSLDVTPRVKQDDKTLRHDHFYALVAESIQSFRMRPIIGYDAAHAVDGADHG